VALRAGEVVYDGPSKALTPAFLSELYGAESEELFLPGLDELREEAKPSRAAAGSRPMVRAVGKDNTHEQAALATSI